MSQDKSLTLKYFEKTDEKVSIIVIHHDKPGYLNICLQSISVTSLNSNYEVIVVDDNSQSQDSIDFLANLEQQDCKVVRMKERSWWSKCANAGAAAADKDSKYLIFLDHDVVVLNPGWIDVLTNVSQTQNSGMVGVAMDSYLMEGIDGKKNKLDYIQEHCMLITKECFDDCGPFNEKLEQMGSPFIFMMKAQQENYSPQAVVMPIVHHYRVFAMDINEYEKHEEKSKATIPLLIMENWNKQ